MRNEWLDVRLVVLARGYSTLLNSIDDSRTFTSKMQLARVGLCDGCDKQCDLVMSNNFAFDGTSLCFVGAFTHSLALDEGA